MLREHGNIMKAFNRPKYWLALLGIALLMLVILAGCEESRGSIEGSVLNKDGTPVAGAIIRAEKNKSGYPSVLLRADDNGYYNIKNVFTGRWAVEFYDASGWQVGLESVQVRADETARLDFTIGSKPSPEHPVKININEVK